MSSLLSVIADDLTGACDVGVQFRKRGLETAVLTRIELLNPLKGDRNVLVIDTESRNIDPKVAYEKVRRTARALKEIGARVVYKKIDSTLRGNLGAELNAVMDELDLKAVIVAPAFPAHNRTTLNGHQYVGGIPLERTEFAQDSMSRSKQSNIAALIGNQTGRKVGNIPLSKVRSRLESLKKEISRLVEAGYEIIVVDAENQEDLAKIAEASADSALLWCGSAGLAAEVSRLLASKALNSRLLAVCGSVNSVALNQIATAQRELDVRVLQPNIPTSLMSEQSWETEVEKIVDEAHETAARDKDIIIRLAGSKGPISKAHKLGRTLGIGRLELASRLLSILGESSKRIIESMKITGLILVGGDTSIRVMETIGAYGIEVEEELFPGIPCGKIMGGKFDGLRVVTKAGGFGDDYTLVNIMRSLRGRIR